MSEDIAVSNFRKYLRINTAHPSPDYESCKQFLLELGNQLHLETNVYEYLPGKPVIILTLRGVNEGLSSLLLNSHTDVVKATKEDWKFGPFEAVKDVDGKIYGRGAQDMKSNGIQYVEALRRLIAKGTKQFLRTVHISFVPGEETGGSDGMERFVETEEFKALNVGFAIDEGLASVDATYRVFYAERSPWWSVVTCKGRTGHGSIYQEDTAAEKFRRVVNSFMSFADRQKMLLESNRDLTIGDVVTVNLTKVEGGMDVNILPAELKAYFDIRMPPSFDKKIMEDEFRLFCEGAGPNVTLHYMVEKRDQFVTKLSDDEPWWKACKSVFKKMDMDIKTQIFPGSTDARFLRAKGYKAIGFSPIINTPPTLHDNNEYIEEDVFLKGIEIYENLIQTLADLPEN